MQQKFTIIDLNNQWSKIIKTENTTFKFVLYTDGYTLDTVHFIPLKNGQYIIEQSLSQQRFITIKEKIGRRTDAKFFASLEKALVEFNQEKQ